METAKILQSDYLDLLFDNRNKHYGSYELRKHYRRRALKALSFTLSVMILGIGTPFVLGKLNAKAAVIADAGNDHVVEMSDILPPPPPAPPLPPEAPAAPPPVAETIKNPPPVIVPDNNVPPEVKPPTVNDLHDKESGPVTAAGQGGNVAAASSNPYSGPFGAGEKPVIGKAGGNDFAGNEPVKFADTMPEFPGGMKALIAYLKKNLNYPEGARADGIQGRVIITFVVNASGGIEKAKVERGIGGGCDKEALRVVNAMPAWKPGKQNGHNVKVYYTLPITFRLDS